jgi:hypothetical protein
LKFRVSKSSLHFARIVHIYVSMALLLLMLFFAFTGITLNHPDWFIRQGGESLASEEVLPGFLLPVNSEDPDWREATAHWLSSQWGVDGHSAEFSEDEVALVHKGPGRYQSITLDLLDGKAYIEQIDYGLIAVLNDLHKGRNSGTLWVWLLDLSSILIILFSLTGAFLLLPQSRRLKKSLLAMAGVSSACALIYLLFVP